MVGTSLSTPLTGALGHWDGLEGPREEVVFVGL